MSYVLMLLSIQVVAQVTKSQCEKQLEERLYFTNTLQLMAECVETQPIYIYTQ